MKLSSSSSILWLRLLQRLALVFQLLFLLLLASAPTPSLSFTLTTSLEHLSNERCLQEESYQVIQWLDLDSSSSSSDKINVGNDDDDDEDWETLPLYPLPTVYLPTTSTSSQEQHTLNNVESQNIQMAQDLLQGVVCGNNNNDDNNDDNKSRPKQPRFCTVLRATDTGRIAHVGTVLRIVGAETQYYHSDEDDDSADIDDPVNNIARIRLTCIVDGLVHIEKVCNGQGWSEKRLLKSKEYLVAKVRPIDNDEDHQQHHCETLDNNNNDDDDDEEDSRILLLQQQRYKTLLKDFQTVKTMYQLELGKDDFPPGMLLQLGNAITVPQSVNDSDGSDDSSSLSSSLLSSSSLWTIAQEWQSVCYTLRHGQQSVLATDRNEKMVDAACSKRSSGPLQLPIHMEDLDLEDRIEIQQLETKAQQHHIQLGMDPTLQFQVLISLPTFEQRVLWLSQMIRKERQRLEQVISEQYA